MIRDEFKHAKKMKKLVKEMETLEEAMGVIENETRTTADAYSGIKARREELEKLQNVLAGSEAMESFKRIDKEFDNLEGDLNKNLDKFHQLGVKLAKKAAEYEHLMFESIDLLIKDQMKQIEEHNNDLLDLRSKQVKIEREKVQKQESARDLIAEYNKMAGKIHAYDIELVDLKLIGYKGPYGRFMVA